MTPSPVLIQVQDVRLPKATQTFSWSVRALESWAVMGRSGSGKTTLIELMTGEPTTAKGKCIAHGSVSCVSDELSRRATPQSIASQASGRGRATDAGEALNLLGLWDVRRSPVHELGTGHIAASKLLRPLLAPSDVVILDLLLDALDPWILPRVQRAFRAWMAPGRALIIVTQRPDVAAMCSHTLVLGGKGALYSGPTDTLLNRSEVLTVETSNASAVRQLAEPFVVEVTETSQGLTLRTAESQALAAKLLTEGYGVVKSIHTRPKTLAETLQELEDRGGLWYPAQF